MKVGREPDARPRARRGRARGDRRRGRAVRRRERRATRASRRSRCAERVRRAVRRHAGSRSRSRSDDLDGLRLLRDRAPAGHGRSPPASTATTLAVLPAHARAGAVDCLQADVTRCGGITGLLARRRALPRRIDLAALGALRAGAARRTPCCAVAPAAPPRVLPRPRADRADALRRRASSPTAARCGPTARARATGSS